AEQLRGSSDEDLAKCEVTLRPLERFSTVLRGHAVLPGSESFRRRADGTVESAVTLTLPLYGTTTVPAVIDREKTAACREKGQAVTKGRQP
ncbi:MAG TPA: hypothetical protein VNT60_10420, partial [Deinococcales bacterium]|nr:hypothetical protein [Deinococcales bacterium]